VALNEDAVHGNHVTGFQVDNISNEDVVDRDLSNLSRTDHFDGSILLLSIELDELSFFLPIVRSTDDNDDDDSDNDGYTLNPFYFRFARLMLDAKGLVQTKS